MQLIFNSYSASVNNILSKKHGRPQKKCSRGQKHSRDGHLSESYSQVSVSDRVTN